jgi:hypothetical protein
MFACQKAPECWKMGKPNNNPVFMKKPFARNFVPIFVAALLVLPISNQVIAQTTFARNGNFVVLQNELVKIEYDLSKGTYSAYNRNDKTSNIIGAALQINDYTTDVEGLTRTCDNTAVADELGSGRKLTVTTSGKGNPDLILELSLYNGKSFVVINGGLKNTIIHDISIKTINPVYHAVAFEGISPKTDLRMLNGPGGAGHFEGTGADTRVAGCETRVYQTNSLESPNNILATFINNGKRKSIVLGGLTYHEFSKYASVKRAGENNLSVEVFSWDPVGKLVEMGKTWLSDERYYIDFCTENPFETLEQYGLCVKAAQKVNLKIHNFPTVCAWYVAAFSNGGTASEPNNTAGTVVMMDAIVKSGFLRYSKVAVRLVPDDYGENNEQGWWNDEYWQKYGHYVKPYETTKKWGQAILDRGGIPLTYSQTGSTSRDFIAAHPDWYLFNDTRLLFDKEGNKSYKTTLDYSDTSLQEHLAKVYQNLKDGGIEGLMFDYPESAFQPNGGFDDKYATAASVYRTIFEIPKKVLGPDSYIDERNVWGQPDGRGCFMDLTAGVVDNQRVWGDNDIVTPEMVSRCGQRWYKNRVIYCYDMDAKNLFKPKNRDGVRQLLTMVYVAAPRLVLANSFSRMTPEMIHDLSRIYPIHSTPKSARPLDAFTRNDGIPHIYDYEIDKSWHQLTFYNPDADSETLIEVEPGKSTSYGGMGLDPSKSYYAYDFWNNVFVGKFAGTGKIQQTLRKGEARMMSVHAVEKNPQVISSDRHVMQGYIDLSNVTWDAAGKVLKGTSKVIGGETTKLVIAVNGFKAVSSKAADAKAELIKGDVAGLIVLAIDKKENGMVEWSIAFSN